MRPVLGLHFVISALLALFAVVAVIGCGDDSSGEVSAATEAPADASGSGDGHASKGSEKQQKGKEDRDGETGGGGGKKGNGSHAKPPTEKEIREEIEKIPPQDRQDFANTAAQGVLDSLGLPGSSVTVTADGFTVFVAVPQKYACGLDAEKVKEVKEQLQQVVISAREFRLNVQSAGSLADYVRNECEDLEIPEAGGPLVYSASGTGTRASDEFKIRSRRWTVTFENGGGELGVYVVKGQDVVKPEIQSTSYEVGKETYRGPGTFRVIADSAARWKVRVYDGT